jgi:hypothetical protein
MIKYLCIIISHLLLYLMTLLYAYFIVARLENNQYTLEKTNFFEYETHFTVMVSHCHLYGSHHLIICSSFLLSLIICSMVNLYCDWLSRQCDQLLNC